jgi:2-phospho-L-lactate guanylyltransferase (CobY/MobA/RfbA family)
VTPADLEQLTAAAPALVAAHDGTTNALSLRDARDFEPLYGAGSAERFEQRLGAQRLDLPGLRDDVDTWDDLERVRARVGPHTRAALE